jgi:hypothetical protein
MLIIIPSLLLLFVVNIQVIVNNLNFTKWLIILLREWIIFAFILFWNTFIDTYVDFFLFFYQKVFVQENDSSVNNIISIEE